MDDKRQGKGRGVGRGGEETLAKEKIKCNYPMYLLSSPIVTTQLWNTWTTSPEELA